MKELSIEEKLKKLYELQTINSKIDELRTLAGELPFEVKTMSDEIEGLRTRLNNMDADIKRCDDDVADYKIKIDNANATIARYKEQQDNVRNNREFENLSKEIEYQTLDIELSQKRITEATERKTALIEEKEMTHQLIADKTVDLTHKKNELSMILSETKEQTEQLTLKGKDIEDSLDDERLLTAFKRIRKKAHNGLAVVKIERDSCGGCHSEIPAQRQIDIRQRKKIIVCEFCGRILVDQDIDA